MVLINRLVIVISLIMIIFMGAHGVLANPGIEETTGQASSLKGRVQASPEYILGAGDILTIFDYVAREEGVFPEIIQEVPVLPDGTATIVPIGQVKAEGLTLSELNQLVKEELSKTIKNPRIFISISKVKPMDIYVIGAVLRPGHYSSDMPGSVYGSSSTGRTGSSVGRPLMTVTSALEQAGGLKTTANVKDITLYRRSTNEKFNIDIWKLLYEGDVTQDALLQSGDVVHVPEVNADNPLSPKEQREIARSTVAPPFINVQVLGAVQKPGIFQLPPESDMIAAIAMAGGPMKNASNNIFIARINPDGTIKKIKLNMKKTIRHATTEEERIKLYPQDLVYVKYSPLKKFADFATVTTKSAIQSLSMAVLFDLIRD
jgi:protein involved in polysaccharide export with SLBB domain